jgi:hypothetical protein
MIGSQKLIGPVSEDSAGPELPDSAGPDELSSWIDVLPPSVPVDVSAAVDEPSSSSSSSSSAGDVVVGFVVAPPSSSSASPQARAREARSRVV